MEEVELDTTSSHLIFPDVHVNWFLSVQSAVFQQTHPVIQTTQKLAQSNRFANTRPKKQHSAAGCHERPICPDFRVELKLAKCMLGNIPWGFKNHKTHG